MRFLIIPGLPLFAIYGSQFIGSRLPLIPGCLITFAVLFPIAIYLLLWLATGRRPALRFTPRKPRQHTATYTYPWTTRP